MPRSPLWTPAHWRLLLFRTAVLVPSGAKRDAKSPPPRSGAGTGIPKDARVAPGSRMWTRTAKCTASCPQSDHDSAANSPPGRETATGTSLTLYYRLRQCSPVPVGVFLQPLSPMATPASLVGSALPYIPLNPAVEPPMSLTTHLNDKQSPFRKLVEESAPALATAAGQSKAGKEFARQLGFYDLAKAPLVVPLPEEVHDKRRHSPTVGTAFDIRTRMMLGQFEPSYSASALGVRAFSFWYARLMKDGERITEMLADSFREAENLMIQGTEEDKDRASIIFTWCEALYRAGLRALFSSLGERLHASKTVDDLFASIPPAMLADVSNLRAANQAQVEQWRTMIRSGAAYTENPHFTGAYLVGGADGDWFIDDTLFDCKVKDTITAPWVRKTLMQLLGYLILDLDNDYQAKCIGIWLPRQATVRTWEIEEILGSDASTILAKARVDVERVMERGVGVVA